MPIATITIFALIVGGIAWIAIVKARDKRDRRRAVWAKVAHERGGRFIVGSGFWTRTNERIEVVIGDIALVLDTYATGGKNSTDYTRVRAAARGLVGCEFRVYQERFFSSLGKSLGTQDVVLGGDAGFDDHFMVKADEPALVRRLWSPALMQGMVGGYAQATISCDGREIELAEVGIWKEAGRMNAALDLLAELAARDVYNLSALGQVAGGSLSWTKDGGPQSVVDAPSRVVIEPSINEGQLQMVARLSESVARDAMTLAVTAGRAKDAELASQLPQSAHAHLSRVGSGRLVVEGSAARFEWDELDVDAAAMRSGAELLSSLSSAGVSGVYR